LQHYNELPTKERRAAKKLAKELLRTVPAAEGLPDNLYEGFSIRGALGTIYQRPENVVAALVYTDGRGHWWGDLVLKTGDGHTQMGTPTDEPVSSYDAALEQVKAQIAFIKSKPEHPIVQQMREDGIDPENFGLIRITHPKFGMRWMLLDIRHEVQEERVAQFKKYVEGLNNIGVVDARDLARSIIFQQAPDFVEEDNSCLLPAPPPDADNHHMLSCAGAVLLACGIINVDFGAVEAPATLH
jgi:hypothetical protein